MGNTLPFGFVLRHIAHRGTYAGIARPRLRAMAIGRCLNAPRNVGCNRRILLFPGGAKPEYVSMPQAFRLAWPPNCMAQSDSHWSLIALSDGGPIPVFFTHHRMSGLAA